MFVGLFKHLCDLVLNLSSVVKLFTHGAIGHWIDPYGRPIELLLNKNISFLSF